MDEIRMVRALYGEPTPDPGLEAAIGGMLADAIKGDHAAPKPVGEPRRRWSRFVPGLVALGTATAIGVAVAAVTLSGGGASEERPAARKTELSARNVLLAAADKVEREPIGRYWYTDQVSGVSYILRPKSGEYAIAGAQSESFRWVGAKPSDGQGFSSRDLPARPLTPKDEALWRKAGSPSSFRVWSNDHYWTYTTKTKPWQVDGSYTEGGFLLPGRGPDPQGPLGAKRETTTVEELQNLPTDPARLAEMFLTFSKDELEHDQRLVKRLRGEGLDPGREPGEMTPRMKVSRVARLLHNVPLPPKVRAGLMRALADQPGIKVAGEATDPLGRRGTALTTDEETHRDDSAEYGAPREEQGDYGFRTEIIFDRETGELLADRQVLTRPGGRFRNQAAGFVITYWAIRDSGWTDTKPTPSAELPFRTLG